ncbi:metalloproteinase inhibitor 1-like [Brevipalpus obovatus]|uniref:metalloproteinase inhibitor 1-like n=1 Tax=Brevipalpus obovatus TaxID=246614 RepID=UPI003D9FA42B
MLRVSMMIRSIGLPLMFALLIFLPFYTDACSCVFSHPQEHFCSADFVALVSIKGLVGANRNNQGSDFDLYNVYKIKLHRLYKTSTPNAFAKGYLFTPSSLNSCSPNLVKNTAYLITGRMVNNNPYVSFCNFIQENSTLTHRQRKGFRRTYGLNCGCKVRDTRSYAYHLFNHTSETLESGHRSPVNSGFCQWDTKWEIENDCQGMHSACVRVKPKVLNGNYRRRNGLLVSENYGHINDVIPQPPTDTPPSGPGYLCRWAMNPDYMQCVQRKKDRDAVHIERESVP